MWVICELIISMMYFQDTQKTLCAIIETFTPSSLEESVLQIKALSLNDPPNLNYLSNLILQKVRFEIVDIARLLIPIFTLMALLFHNIKPYDFVAIRTIFECFEISIDYRIFVSFV